MRPRFEDPIETAQDLIDRNITIFERNSSYDYNRGAFEVQGIPEYKILGERMERIGDWDDYWYYVDHHVIGNGTHALFAPFLTRGHLMAAPMEKWWRSKEIISWRSLPYHQHFSGREWKFNEASHNHQFLVFTIHFIQDLARHLLRFQQVISKSKFSV